MYGECDILMNDVLLTLHGEQHARRRAVELQLFRKDFARYYEHAVLPDIVVHTLALYLEQGSVDLPDFGARVTLNLSARIAGLTSNLSLPQPKIPSFCSASSGSSVKARPCFTPPGQIGSED